MKEFVCLLTPCIYCSHEPEEEQQELEFWKKNQPKANGQGELLVVQETAFHGFHGNTALRNI